LPSELSGGERQRVGIARAIAARPPVVLMDEPFGAVDPITRQRLQDELMSIQAELGKTIVCVTHDIDEAVKLGDRICILREGGHIAQYDTPENILAAPANRFVEDFVGAGSSLKQLTLTRVSDVELKPWPTAKVGDPAREAVARAREAGEKSVVVLDSRNRPRAWVWLRDLEEQDTVRDPGDGDVLGIDRRATLNDALDDMLTSSHGAAIVTGRREEFVGVVDFDSVTAQIRQLQETAEQDGQQDGGSA
jgi:osmoprotectant transport system ATP-binding protein